MPEVAHFEAVDVFVLGFDAGEPDRLCVFQLHLFELRRVISSAEASYWAGLIAGFSVKRRISVAVLVVGLCLFGRS